MNKDLQKSQSATAKPFNWDRSDQKSNLAVQAVLDKTTQELIWIFTLYEWNIYIYNIAINLQRSVVPSFPFVYTVALLLIKQATKEEKSQELLIKEYGH